MQTVYRFANADRAGSSVLVCNFEQYTQTVRMKDSNNCIMIERFVAELDTT
jgi:hypothetical protein